MLLINDTQLPRQSFFVVMDMPDLQQILNSYKTSFWTYDDMINIIVKTF
jgi:hypothetical protein